MLSSKLRVWAMAGTLVVLIVVGGCPPEADVPAAGDPNSEPNAAAGAGTAGGAESEPPAGGGALPPGRGGLIVATVEGVTDQYVDIYPAGAHQPLEEYEPTNEVIALPPGEYDVTPYYNATFHYAERVTVQAGSITTVTLGGIELRIVPGAEHGYYDIYDQTGETELAAYNAPNVIVSAPAGTFTLKEYFNDAFTYASDVVVTAGEVTTVTMGAIRLVTVDGAEDGRYDIYDSTGQTQYTSYRAPNTLITAPAGTFVLKQYFNDAFTYASDVTVTAGGVTTVTLGAIRYHGTLFYDLYSGGQLLASYNAPNEIVSAPAGDYWLTEYFDDEHVLATDVTVTAGQITEVE